MRLYAPPPKFEFLFGLKVKPDTLGHDVVRDAIENEHPLDEGLKIDMTKNGIMIN